MIPVVFALAGVAVGIGQYFLLALCVRRALVNGHFFLLAVHLFIPMALFVVGAFISASDLPWAAGGYGAALTVCAAVNFLIHKNKKDG